MNDDERREMLRNNYAAQMEMLGYQPDGNPKDLVEVVRCKNCEYYRGGVLSGYCDRWFRQTGGEETYCSEGRQVVKQK